MGRVRSLGQICLLSAILFASSVHAADNSALVATALDQLLAKDSPSGGSASATPLDDSGFARRAWFDIVGDLPTPQQLTAFVLDPSVEKRQLLVARLLANPQYGQNWARYWRDVILARRSDDRALLVSNPLVVSLTDQLNRNRPWNEIVHELVTATGDVRENGATAVLVAQDGETEAVAAEVSRIFLGVQIQCAQCHDHLTDPWKREQFHQFAAFFPRVAVRPLLTADKRTLLVAADDNGVRGRKTNGRRGAREHFMPDLEDPAAVGERMQPVFFLTGQSLEFGTSDAKRRETLARWMADSPWFARALVNRMWAELIGQGFHEPVDDLGPNRETAEPEPFVFLAEEFEKSGYDLQWLLRTITSTDLYQRQALPREVAQPSPLATCPQRLRADQLYNALTRALDVSDLATGAFSSRGGGYLQSQGARAAFASFFDYDPSLPRDEISSSIAQALAMMNSPLLQQHITAANSRSMLARLLAEVDDDKLLVAELYFRCLAREPTQREVATCLSYLKDSPTRAEGAEDLLWALLNSTEFLYRN